ncbi:MAG: hypothetical protein QW445_07425 [Candidatus Bathyarchaeia archaeon]
MENCFSIPLNFRGRKIVGNNVTLLIDNCTVNGKTVPIPFGLKLLKSKHAWRLMDYFDKLKLSEAGIEWVLRKNDVPLKKKLDIARANIPEKGKIKLYRHVRGGNVVVVTDGFEGYRFTSFNVTADLPPFLYEDGNIHSIYYRINWQKNPEDIFEFCRLLTTLSVRCRTKTKIVEYFNYNTQLGLEMAKQKYEYQTYIKTLQKHPIKHSDGVIVCIEKYGQLYFFLVNNDVFEIKHTEKHILEVCGATKK